MIPRILVAAIVATRVAVLAAQAPVTQAAPASKLKLDTGKEIYDAGCVSCHGPDGKGQLPNLTAFERPATFPDFSDCPSSTPESRIQWRAIINNGGEARAFSQIMPSFKDLLTAEQIDKVIAHLRSLCTDPWPLGDLNLPRPLVTEKAFPEDEAVLTTVVSRDNPGSVINQFQYEHRIGRRSQYEVLVPFALRQQPSGTWNRGLGDIAVAFKHVLFDHFASGSIVSGGAELTLPTGKENEGLGNRLTIFEPFAAASQLLPHQGFLHVHTGFEIPLNIETASNEFYFRVAAGKTLTENRFGRIWSPMVELLANRELASDENTQWDLLPQMQVSLSRRQHVAVNGGVRIPVNERDARHASVMVYLLWDWFDGGFFEGWR